MSSKFAIEFKNVSKTYGSCQACKDVTFQVTAGTIHGIVGENGAGKSTAMKLLFGLDIPDTGSIHLFGDLRPLWRSPLEAKAAGIGMVHQHFMLAEPFTALDNLILAEGGSAFHFLNRRAALAKYRALAEAYGFEIPFQKTVAELTVGEQQRVEILKVLAQDSKIIILDEPTAVLTPAEIRAFFEQVRTLKAQGRTVLIITHKLREIMELTDEVTVFRQGETKGTLSTANTSAEALAERMIGRKQKPGTLPPAHFGDDVLCLKNFGFDSATGTSLQGVSLRVRAGELVGIAGVEGNGQDAIIQSLTQGRKHRARITGDGTLFSKPLNAHSVTEWRAQGAAFLPEDRLRTGVLENRPAFENVLLGQQQKYSALIPWSTLIEKTTALFEEYDVTPKDPHLSFGSFSGGNQQKIVVGRELSTEPRFVLACHPTRGVDIGASEGIHQKLIERSRTHGAATLVISSEIEELMKICDRIHVLYRGRILKEFERPNFDEHAIGAALGGVV